MRNASDLVVERTERRLSVAEAARELGVIPRTVLNWIHAGRLQALRPGRNFQIPQSEIARLLEPTRLSASEPPTSRPAKPTNGDGRADVGTEAAR